MKRALLLGAVLASVASVAFAAAGISVNNQSSVDIDHLYTSAPGKKAWGADLLAGADPIERGKSATVVKLVPGTYDLQLVDDDDGGKPCIVSNVKVKAGVALKLTKKMTAACS
ncbi:MAG TPA: hypothetical protein VHA35_15075 [Dongiaceae bacterium]|nr:hypothetical protein [Dongiaceae bacterium]